VPNPTAATSDSIRVDLIDSGTIYASGIGGRIMALDATGGAERWSYQTSGPLAIVRLIEGDAVIGTSHWVKPNSTSLEPVTTVFALDARTGAVLWKRTAI
jgi:outer membrane protein assembly factor BamB